MDKKEPFPNEIEQILKNQIVIMGMLQNVKCLLEDTVIPDEIQNIQDTYEVLKSNKKLKEMESEQMQVFEKIIDSLEQKADSIYKDKTVEARFIMLGDARKVVQEIAEEYNNGWIPVSERLPSFEERRKSYCRYIYGSGFIVMIEGATMPTTLYIKMEEDIWFDDNHNYYSIIAWQPLPEPYQPKGEQE